MNIKQVLVYGFAIFWWLTCAGAGCRMFHNISRDARADSLAVFKVVKDR